MLEITLKIDNQDKKFKAVFISARMLKKSIKLAEQVDGLDENDVTEEISDLMANYITDVFCKQFTIDQLYDGLDVSDMLPKFYECLNTVMKKFAQKANGLAQLNPNG